MAIGSISRFVASNEVGHVIRYMFVNIMCAIGTLGKAKGWLAASSTIEEFLRVFSRVLKVPHCIIIGHWWGGEKSLTH